jgi:hypothetical protein
MMPPKLFDPVAVELGDGKTRLLRFSMGALRRAQTRLRELRGDKISIFQLLSPKNKEQLSPDEIVVLFHQALRHEDKDLTEEQVEEMIDARQLDYLAEKLAEAMGGTVERVKPDGGMNEGERPLSPSPGATSGPSGEST